MEMFVYGIDVGGTNTKLALFNGKAMLKDTVVIPTRTDAKGIHVLPDIKMALDANMEKHGIKKEQVAGIGVGVPGPVTADGVVNKCVNLGWDSMNISKQLSLFTGGIKVKATNDANAAALGEMFRGGGQGFKNLILVTFGTGIGGGIIIDGKIYSGATGAAGEIGHIPFMEGETEKCSCGKCGCLEQYISASAIGRITTKILEERTEDSALRKYQTVTAKEVYDEAKNGDPIALGIVKLTGDRIGRAFGMLASMFNPEAIVIGGGMAKAGQILLNSIDDSFKKNAFHATAGAEIRLATLGNLAGVYGGAKLIFDDYGV